MQKRLTAKEFHGEVLASREVAGFTLFERRYPAGYETVPHLHERAYLCLILAGASEQAAGAVTRIRAPLQVFHYPAGETQRERFGDDGGRILGVEISGAVGARLSDRIDLPARSVGFERGPVRWLAMRLHREFSSSDAAAPLAIEGLILELLAEVIRSPRRQPARAPTWVAQAREVIAGRLVDGVSLDAVAAEVNVHPVTLARGFRAHCGCTVGEYVRRLRVERAAREICRPGARLVDVALEAGFSSQAHFTRVFKHVTGLTPAAYRATVGADGAISAGGG